MWFSLPRHKTPRLAPVLFQQGHAVDGHAAIDGFAHVVNREQGDLHSGQYINKINDLAHSRSSLDIVICSMFLRFVEQFGAKHFTPRC